MEVFRTDHGFQLPFHAVGRGPDLPVVHTEVVASGDGIVGSVEPYPVIEYVHMGVADTHKRNDGVLFTDDGFLFHKLPS